MMTFHEAKALLLNQEKTVKFKSLTSDKIHEVFCTVNRDFQNGSDKIIVWNITEDRWNDIEVTSIMSIT